MGKYITAFFFMAILGLMPRVFAVCVYNPAANAIWIYDYAADLPAGPRQLLFADQVNEWGLVTYDSSNDTYTVNANCWIGRDNHSDTFFQLGAPGRPHEKLVLNGNLVIYPSSARRVNRLTIGCPDDPDIRAQLLFQNAPGKTHTLHTGAYYQGNAMTPGVLTSGELHVYNGLISATDTKYPIGRKLYLYLDMVVLKNATIARVAGTIGYGVNARNSVIENTVFEDSGNAFAWGAQAMRGVTFRRLGTAFNDSRRYPLAATLTECRFEDNDINWSLSAGNIYLVDCKIDPPHKSNRYVARTNAVFSVHYPKTGTARTAVSGVDMPESIRVVSSRHVIFKVVDSKGRPAKNAHVAAHCEQDDRMQRVAVTDADGLTPGHGEEGALLLDAWEESAGNVANEPVRREFSHAIEITRPKEDAVQVLTGLRPVQSWQVVEVMLPVGE